MRVDVVLDPTDCPLPTLVEAARIAEEIGFDGVFTYDHLSGVALSGSGIRHVWPTLGAIAAVTRRVAVGPLVLNATRHHPAEIAVATASLQELSGGRVVLGLGAGAGPGSPFARELTMVGLTPLRARTRRRVVEESIRTIRALWRGRTVSGAHFATRSPEGFLVPDPEPPLIVGANGPLMAGLAGRFADGVNLHASEPDLAGLAATARAAAAARVPGDGDDAPMPDDGGGTKPFQVTVEAPLRGRWLDPSSRDRRALDELDVARLALRWRAPDGLEALTACAAALASRDVATLGPAGSKASGGDPSDRADLGRDGPPKRRRP